MKKHIIILIVSLCMVSHGYSQYTEIPDPSFEQALIDLGIDSDGVINGQVLTSDIEGVEVLDLSDKFFNNLIGIEDFTSLKTLDISFTFGGGEFLDLTMVPTLESFYANDGQDATRTTITDINLSNNPNLKKIEILENWQLRRIDLRNSDQYIDSLEFHYYPNYSQWETVTCDMLSRADLLCVEVTDPEAAENGEGFYENWNVDGESCMIYTTDCTLGISDFEVSYFQIYPNPAKEYFKIESEIEMEAMEVFNLQGEKIKSFSSNHEVHSVADLSSGLYLLKIQFKSGKNYVKKLLVE